MKKNYSFEVSQLKKYRLVIFSIAFFTQLLFLYFFTIVGRFDSAESDDILRNYISLSGLASTISMCMLVVYGTVVVNRFLVKNYIGENKARLYAYPVGRSQLFHTKVTAFLSTFFIFQLLGISLSNILFLIIETLFPILDTAQPAVVYLVEFFVTAIATVVLTISIIFLSSIVGIHLNSTVATMVTGIILIVIFGNILAMAFVSNLLITLSSAILIAVITGIAIKITGTKIDKEDVLTR